MMTTLTTILTYTLTLGAICSLIYIACRLLGEYLAMRKLPPLEVPVPVEVPKQTAQPKKKVAYKTPAKKKAVVDAPKKAAKKQPAKKKTASRKKPQA